MLFAGAGYRVHLYDVTLDLVAKAVEDIEHQLTVLETKGMLRGTISPTEQLKLISSMCLDTKI